MKSQNLTLAPSGALVLRLIFVFVLGVNLTCSVYASFQARGLFSDAAALLVVIYDGNWPSISGTRATVEILRQIPIALLARYTSASLFECGQALTLVMLTLPTIFCALCWLVAPPNQKSPILFPLAALLIGFAATSMHAVGEASIATSYYWILVFVLLFRTRSIVGKVVFFLLCVPVFRLHEGTFPLTIVLLIYLAVRAHHAAGNWREQLFVGLSALLLTMILANQILSIIYPAFPNDRAIIIRGLVHFEFLYFDHHFNLPLLTGAIAMVALGTVSWVGVIVPAEKARRYANVIVVVWVAFAVAAISVAITIEESFSPFSQLQARYQPPIVSALLASAMIFVFWFRLPEELWANRAMISILLSLCITQATADVVATRRWNAYVGDLRSRLAQGRGLIPWEQTLQTGDERADTNWRLFEIGWIIPYMCIIFAPDGVVTAIIDLPRGTSFRLLDPERPDLLPRLRGVDFAPYKRFLANRS